MRAVRREEPRSLWKRGGAGDRRRGEEGEWTGLARRALEREEVLGRRVKRRRPPRRVGGGKEPLFGRRRCCGGFVKGGASERVF